MSKAANLEGGSPRVSESSESSPIRSGFVLSTFFFFYRILSLLHRAIQQTNKLLLRLTDTGQRMFGGVCAEALSVEEKGALTVRIYDSYSDYFSVGDKLYAWEEPWFERRLPAAPARVLVGACGTGREAVALAERGYRVDALEPAPDFVEESRRRLGARGRIYKLSYEQLSSIMLDGNNSPESDLRGLHYDAVVLGSGSLTHVLDPREQARLLRSMCVLCPRGPILASFFSSAEQGAVAPVGRARRLGRWIGRVIARARGMSPGYSERMSYRAHSGFAYTFMPSEIEHLAQAVGRTATWEDGRQMEPFHYATFLPPPSGLE